MNRIYFRCLMISVLLVWIGGPKGCFAQAAGEFKRNLYEQGLSSLSEQGKVERLELENALVAALYVDADHLIEPLVARFNIRTDDYLRAVLEHSETLGSFAPVVEQLNRSDLSIKEVYVLSILAFKMGLRDEAIEPMLRAMESFFLKNQSQPGFNEKGIKEEIYYSYSLGLIHRNTHSNSLELASEEVGGQLLRDHLRAFFLWKVESKKIPLEKLGEAVSKIQSVNFRNAVLLKVLSEMSEENIAKDSAFELIKELVKLHFESKDEGDELYSYEWELDSLDSYLDPLPQSGAKDILKLCQRSGQFESDITMLNFLEAVGMASGEPAGFIKKWATRVTVDRLKQDKFDSAQAVANAFQVELPKRELTDFAKRNNRLDLIGGATALENPFEPDEQKYLVEQKAKALTRMNQQMTKAPDDKKLKALTEVVWTCQRFVDEDGKQKLIIEDEIMEVFQELKNQPSAARTIAGAFNIFLGTQQANRDLLQKMMSMLPVENQVATVYQIQKLEKRIRDSKVDERSDLLEEAMLLLNLAVRPGGFAESEGRLAFAFAMVGDEQAVRLITDQIAQGKKRTWILFQCAKVFPPQGSLNKKATYINLMKGGMF